MCAQPLDAFSGEQKESVSGVSTRECGPDGAASRGLGPALEPAALLRSEPGRGGHAATRRAPRREAGPPSSLAGDLTAPPRPVPARRLLLQTGEEWGCRGDGAGGGRPLRADPVQQSACLPSRARPRPRASLASRREDGRLCSAEPRAAVSAPMRLSATDPQPLPSRRAQFASGFRPRPRHPSGLSGRAEAAALELCGARGASPRPAGPDRRQRTRRAPQRPPASGPAPRHAPCPPNAPPRPPLALTAHTVAGSLGITLCTLSFPHTT